MKLTEFQERINSFPSRSIEDVDLVVEIKLPYTTVGPSPTVEVKNFRMGFDWDKGKCILIPEENLTKADDDFAAKMKSIQDKLGWTEYENRVLVAEIKRLKKALGHD